jgi:nucleoid-associated protein YgaU
VPGRRYTAPIASALDLRRADVQKVLERYLDAVKREAAAGDWFQFHPFGSVQKRHYGSRKGFNPREKKAITIAARDRIVFHPSASLKERLNKPLKSVRDAESAAYLKKKEQEKYIAFDKDAPPGLPVAAPPAGAEPEAPRETPEVPPAAPEAPADPGIPENGGGVSAMAEETKPGAGDAGKKLEQSEVEAIVERTSRAVQKKMLIYAGGAVLVILAIFLAFYLLSFKSRSFYQLVKGQVLQVNKESRLTYEEMDKLVTQRMQDLQLDLSQTRDLFKRELTAMQDDQQRKIDQRVMEQVKRELRSVKGFPRGQEPVIRIVHYRVRKGDNLWKISELKLRDPFLWVSLYRTNGKKIRDPDLIYPGQEIIIPMVLRKCDSRDRKAAPKR